MALRDMLAQKNLVVLKGWTSKLILVIKIETWCVAIVLTNNLQCRFTVICSSVSEAWIYWICWPRSSCFVLNGWTCKVDPGGQNWLQMWPTKSKHSITTICSYKFLLILYSVDLLWWAQSFIPDLHSFIPDLNRWHLLPTFSQKLKCVMGKYLNQCCLNIDLNVSSDSFIKIVKFSRQKSKMVTPSE
jgi:hypothetical protein